MHRLENSTAKINAMNDFIAKLQARLDELSKRPFIDEKCRNDFKALRDFCSGTMDALERVSREELAKQEKDMQSNLERWQALAERLDAQGARIQELEAKVKIGFPTVPEEKSPEPVDKGGEIG